MKGNKIFLMGIVAVMITGAVVYAGGVIQQHSLETDIMAEDKKGEVVAEDEIEVIGTPTNDDPWEEVKKITTAYYSKSGIQYKGTVKVIDDNGDKEKIIEEHTFEYTLLDGNYHYRLGDMEIISKKNLLVAVDHAGKSISVSRGQVSNHNRLFDIAAFKKLMQENSVNAQVTQSDGEKILTIDSINDANIQGYRIYYSPETYQVKKMLIGMSRLNRLEEGEDSEVEHPAEEGAQEYYYYLEVLFETVKELSMKAKDFNPERRFINIAKDRIEIIPAYQGYQLLSTITP